MSTKETEPIITQKISIDGVNLQIARTCCFENRPTIIFLHESFGCIGHWKDFPYRLGKAALCDVLIYDRQGYGASDPLTIDKRRNDYLETEADVLCRLIQALRIENVILFGHSDGGTIALIAAAKYPAIIKGIITEGAHVFVEEESLEGIRKAEAAYKETNLREKLQRYHGDKTDRVFRIWADTWSSGEFRPWNIEHLLPDIVCPALIIQGIDDEYGTVLQVESILKNTSGYSDSLMPQSGHTPHRDCADEVIRASVRFIERITSQ